MADFNAFVIIFLIIFIIWLPQAIYQILVWSYWWQVKEYRLDRFWIFLKTADGRQKLGLNIIILKFIVLVFSFIYIPISLLLFFYQDLILIKDLFQKRARKPVITKRINKIYITGFFGIVLTIFAFYFLGFRRALLLGEFALILTPYVGILWTIPIVKRVKKEEIQKAKAVLSKIKPTVIGITGSYGKTTTKEFVAHLLSQKFITAKTEGSENTEFGIARKTQKNVFNGTKFFVVEMGAYKKGEIRKLADIVNPSIGIITGIEEQHLSLFGSLQDIKDAKYELIESLPKEGIALFNLTNEYCRGLYQKARQANNSWKILGYYAGQKRINFNEKPDIVLTPEKISSAGCEFELEYENENKRFYAPIKGLHLLQNLAAAILVARQFGLSWKMIKRGIETLVMPEGTMNVYRIKNNVLVIDDSRNSNPSAFSSALDYLSLIEGKKKVVITNGIIELGDSSDYIHFRLGKEMKHSIDKILLTNKDFYESFKKGLGKYIYKLVLIDERFALKNIEKILTEGNCVVLLEGRLPSLLTQKFKN